MRIVFRFLYRLYRAGMRVKGWGARRLTRAGVGVAGATMLAMVMGVDAEHNLEYQAFAFLAVLLGMAVVFALGFRARFTAERVLPRFGTAGIPLHYSVSLTNRSVKPQSGLTLLEQLTEPIPSFAEWFAAQFQQAKGMRSFHYAEGRRTNPFRATVVREASASPLGVNERVQVPMEITPVRRGMLRFERLLVARTDPFNLFRALVEVRLPQTVVILPRRYRLPALALPGSLKYQEGGVAMASHVGQSEEFMALRDYRPGDPLRHIHWRSWARVGKPVVKEYEDEFFVRHALVLDTFTDLECSEIFEEAVSVAASFAWTVQTQESLLDLLFVGEESYCFTTGRGLAHGDQMLEILASVRPSAKSFSALEPLVLNHAGSVSGCICVLIAWDTARQEFVRKLQVLGVPMLVLVIVPPGSTAIDPGPMRSDPAHFHILETGQVEQGLARLE